MRSYKSIRCVKPVHVHRVNKFAQLQAGSMCSDEHMDGVHVTEYYWP